MPLTQDHWSQTLETLMDWMDLDDTLSDAVVVRRFMEVVARAPHPDLVRGMGQLDATTIDCLQAAGASDALAMRLIGEESGFFASRGGKGEYLVSVLLAGRGEEMTAAGATLPRAIVGVLALILSQPDQGEHAPMDNAAAERGYDHGGYDHGGYDHSYDHSYAGLPSATMLGATLH